MGWQRPDFHIGGYQVCEKWLKDRRGRTLSKDDILLCVPKT
ncbi:type ISP restriction/modification enzyme [Bradyrhizobium sp. Ash2021]